MSRYYEGPLSTGSIRGEISVTKQQLQNAILLIYAVRDRFDNSVGQREDVCVGFTLRRNSSLDYIGTCRSASRRDEPCVL